MKRLLNVAVVIAALAISALLLGLCSVFRHWTGVRQRLEKAVWTTLRAGFGMVVRVHGVPLAKPGTLYVANHVSWTDIVVLGGLLDAGFVAKQEVAGWPLIGPGARRYGCVFVARDRRGSVGSQSGAIAECLAAGSSLILFPEGTTGDGSRVLPFRSSLFAGVAGRGTVQPVTLSCRRRDGGRFDAGERRRFAWLDDDALLPHAMQLAWSGGALIDVHFGQPLECLDRKVLAQSCHAAISAGLAGEHEPG